MRLFFIHSLLLKFTFYFILNVVCNFLVALVPYAGPAFPTTVLTQCLLQSGFTRFWINFDPG
jgi:hypothetical protein